MKSISLISVSIMFVFIYCSQVFGQSLDEYIKTLSINKPTVVIYENANVITMNSDEVLYNYSVVIKNGIIEEIGKSSEIKLPVGKTVKVIDATGKYLMPGLADMHVHLYDKDDLLLFLVNGITTIRCMHGDPGILKLKEQINKNELLGPAIFTSSPTLDGDERSGFVAITTPEDADNAVLSYKTEGYDYIKVFNGLKKDVYNEIVKAGKNNNIKIVGHIPETISISDIIAAKQYSIEHFMMIKPEIGNNVKLIAESGIWLCPTFSVYYNSQFNKENMPFEPDVKYMHKSLIKEWKRFLPVYISNEEPLHKVKDFKKYGGKLIVGTDCRLQFVLPGFSIHHELELFVKYGLTPFETLTAATLDAAKCLEIHDKIGSIEKGKEANLVLLTDNPLSNISYTRKIEGVMLKGLWLDKNAIDDILQKIEKKRN